MPDGAPMGNLLLRWILLSLSVVMASYLTQLLGLQFEVDVSSAGQVLKLFVGVAFWAFLNATLGNILRLMTVPLNCLTFGLVSLVINACMLWIVASQNFGFTIKGEWASQFMAALIACVLISAISSLLESATGGKKKDEE
jgi:putative membrane protein